MYNQIRAVWSGTRLLSDFNRPGNQLYARNKQLSLDMSLRYILYTVFNPLYTELTLPHYILEESNFNFR